MPSKLFSLLSFILFILLSIPAMADNKPFIIDTIPIQHEGRIKPLSTYSEVLLLKTYGKKSFNEMSSEQFLTELLLDSKNALKRPIFNIANPDIVHLLGLEYDSNHKYNFIELLQSMSSRMEMINKLNELDPAKLTGSQSQLLNLYINLMEYFEIARSLSLVKYEFEINNIEVSELLNVNMGDKLNYLDMIQRKARYKQVFHKLREYSKPAQDDILKIGEKLRVLSRDKNAKIFRVMPAQGVRKDNTWFSPWEVMNMGEGTPETAKLISLWTDLAVAYRVKDEELWNKSYLEIIGITSKYIDPNKTYFEKIYNSFDLFKISTGLYLIALLLIGLYAFSGKLVILKVSNVIIMSALIIHGLGLLSRMYIMGRPPVTTLYESILFVGFISVLFSMLLEYRNKNSIGSLIAAFTGSFFLFLSIKYVGDGDSLGVLVAVLNTNFWLATHVVTITIGYGACFVAGLLAHIYLIQKSFNFQDKISHNSTFNNMIGVSLIALFFSILGTILGGIWADQSWGRFWGWDPKENGAMFICLWLITLLHGKLAGQLKPIIFAYGMVLTNIVVVLAWFGVNLLGIGLHSYGFIDSVATNIVLFIIIELSFIIFIISARQLRKKNEV